jgi:hypothetical protein
MVGRVELTGNESGVGPSSIRLLRYNMGSFVARKSA